MDGHLPAGLKPKKSFGQNFLVDEKVVADLVAAAELTRSDTVVEVGAGTGVLTKALAQRAGKVLAFEIDRDLIPVQRSELRNYQNIEIINKDFLRFTINDLRFTSYKLVGSIPYQITSPLIHKILKLEPKPSLAVLLIQKEVAEKIIAQPPKATYLSNIVKLLGEVEPVRFVPKNAFWPAPKVDGAIVKLLPNDYCLVPSAEIDKFQRFLHRGFQNPRKMLRNKFDFEVLKSAGITPTQRAQELDLTDWFKVFDASMFPPQKPYPRRGPFRSL